MYGIIESKRTLPDGTTIPTFTRSVASANILEVECGTTGTRGGDSGHGGRTYFRIQNECGTDIDVRLLPDAIGDNTGFEVILGGDCELETIIRALKFITKGLEDGYRNVFD